jgi:hypothetical protein
MRVPEKTVISLSIEFTTKPSDTALNNLVVTYRAVCLASIEAVSAARPPFPQGRMPTGRKQDAKRHQWRCAAEERSQTLRVTPATGKQSMKPIPAFRMIILPPLLVSVTIVRLFGVKYWPAIVLMS